MDNELQHRYSMFGVHLHDMPGKLLAVEEWLGHAGCIPEGRVDK